MYKILIAVEGNYKCQMNKLKEAGLEISHVPIFYSGDKESFVKEVSDYDCVIIGAAPWDDNVIEQLKSKGKLKLIVKFGVGVDNIDMDVATKRGIAVANAPGGNSRAVAEHTLALMLAVTRNIVMFDNNVKTGFWDDNKSDSIIGKTIGLLGFGNIAKQLAMFLSGFPVDIITYDIHMDENKANSLGVKYAKLDKFIFDSDIISVHIPLTESTRHMIDKDFIKKMKASSYIINTSRGDIIKEQDLIYALKNGLIKGAALDVFQEEPLPLSSELLNFDNVILTPHSASITEEAFANIMNICINNVIDFFTKNEFKNVLNPNYQNYLT